MKKLAVVVIGIGKCGGFFGKIYLFSLYVTVYSAEEEVGGHTDRQVVYGNQIIPYHLRYPAAGGYLSGIHLTWVGYFAHGSFKK